MNLQAVCHIPMSNYAYAFHEKELHIRIRTAKDDCEDVTLVLSQKHRWKDKQRFSMEKIASDRLFDYFQYRLVTDDARLGYYFELKDKTETLIYSESGFSAAYDDANAYFHYFQYPYINAVDVHHIPEWVHEAVFYQIFVERFCNGNPGNDPENAQQWNSPPSPHSFYGGDLQGVIDRLDYLQELGVNGIYLTPVFQSPSNHKYDIVDYQKIDEAFGDKAVLCELVTKAHKKGIHVMLDGVFNHSSWMFAPFRDVVKNGDKSQYCDWFHIDSFPVFQYTEQEISDYSNPLNLSHLNYRVFGTSPSMPKLNTSNPQLKKYLLDTVADWTRETGIDGWRLDVSDEVDHVFWRDFRRVVRAINPQALIIGENWHNAYPWLKGDQFDGVMNYPVTKSCIQYFAMRETNASQFAADLSGYLMWNSEQVNHCMLNLLDSHDTVRFLTWCNGDIKRMRLAVLFLFSYVGIPCTYYGDEIGMEGKGDPDCRRTFDWDKKSWNTELFQLYQQVIKIRKETDALKYGEIHMYAADDVFYLVRSYRGQRTVTVLNNTCDKKTILLPPGAKWLLHTEPNPEKEAELVPFSGGIYSEV